MVHVQLEAFASAVRRILGPEHVDDTVPDVLPPSFAFGIATVALGVLLVHGLFRTFAKKDVHLINGTTSEFLVVVGFNALVMAISQLGYLLYVAYAILGIAILLLIHDVSCAYSITKGEENRSETENRALVERSFPTMIFSDSFREEYVSKMTGGLSTLESESKYGDFVHVGMRQVLLLAVAQFALLVMFVTGLVVRGAPPFERMQPYTFYWVGIVLEACYVAGEGQMIAPYDNYVFFVNTLRAARKNKTVVEVSEPKAKYDLHYNDFNLWARFIASFAINNSGFLILMVTLPMQLSWSGDPTEFVLNAIAAFFVVELDDLSSPIVYDVIGSDNKIEVDIDVVPYPSSKNTYPSMRSTEMSFRGVDDIEEGEHEIKLPISQSEDLSVDQEGRFTNGSSGSMHSC